VHVIAGASPDNTPAGYYWTFLFPEILFIVSALILWALFGRPHQRVPARRIVLGLSSRAPAAGAATTAATAAAPITADRAGTASTGGGQLTATDEAEPSAGSDETDGEQTSTDGAGAGE
jgi:hypothetical protein